MSQKAAGRELVQRGIGSPSKRWVGNWRTKVLGIPKNGVGREKITKLGSRKTESMK